MPIINVNVAAKPSKDLSRAIAEKVTAITQTELRKDPTITAVAVQYFDPDHWFAGGKSLAEQGTSSYWLDIKVVDGTNTKQELARYLASIFAGMNEVLGEVHNESYALVDEVSAAAYGYGGKTQEFRFIAGQLAVK
jgi:4-oxalocrotonate tautomerase